MAKKGKAMGGPRAVELLGVRNADCVVILRAESSPGQNHPALTLETGGTAFEVMDAPPADARARITIGELEGPEAAGRLAEALAQVMTYRCPEQASADRDLRVVQALTMGDTPATLFQLQSALAVLGRVLDVQRMRIENQDGELGVLRDQVRGLQ